LDVPQAARHLLCTLEVMKISVPPSIIKWLIVLPSLVALWFFIRQFFAPDACLDLGGSFNYAQWACSYTEDHAYVDTPFYFLGSFWVFAFSSIVSALVWLCYRRRGNAF
jgi:hypothetical protein